MPNTEIPTVTITIPIPALQNTMAFIQNYGKLELNTTVAGQLTQLSTFYGDLAKDLNAKMLKKEEVDKVLADKEAKVQDIVKKPANEDIAKEIMKK